MARPRIYTPCKPANQNEAWIMDGREIMYTVRKPKVGCGGRTQPGTARRLAVVPWTSLSLSSSLAVCGGVCGQRR